MVCLETPAAKYCGENMCLASGALLEDIWEGEPETSGG